MRHALRLARSAPPRGWPLARRSARAAASPLLSPSSLVLGIETSCDDTAAAVVSADGRVLGECVMSQAELHAPHGGVVPQLAAAAHAAAVDACVSQALAAAGVRAEALSAVGVTQGPGLALCLRVGVLKAHTLAARHDLPLVYVHHMEAHALVARLSAGGLGGSLRFPFVALLVSGGHNLLVLCTAVGRYTVLGATLDDALGEAYDKTARLLGLDVGGGGGPALEALARRGDPGRFPLRVPLRSSGAHRTSCEFSYAGLKTATRQLAQRELGPESERADWGQNEQAQTRADIAAAFQTAAVAHLAERSERAMRWARQLAPQADTLVVAGGVACNQVVRAALAAAAARAGFSFLAPPPRHCTDNGVMVAWAAIERLSAGVAPLRPLGGAEGAAELAALESDDPGLCVALKPRWPLGERHPDSLAALSATRSLKKVRLDAPLTGVTTG